MDRRQPGRLQISIHALREEGDSSCGPALTTHSISIHALREEGDVAPVVLVEICPISIHALREEGDHLEIIRRQTTHHISIHALREEGDFRALALCRKPKEFLSTPSARRATWRSSLPGGLYEKISIHALREEGDPGRGSPPPAGAISIHALREEGDGPAPRRYAGDTDFYPRPPRGGRQQKQRQNLYFQTNYTTFCTNLEEP